MNVGSNPGFRITELWAFLSIGEDDEEGVCGVMVDGTLYPMIMADLVRLEEFRPIAEDMARETGKPVNLTKFTQREDVETL